MNQYSKTKIFILAALTVLISFNISATPLVESHYDTTEDLSMLMQKVKTAPNEPSKLEALKNLSMYLALNQPNKAALTYIDKTAALAEKLSNEHSLIQTSLLYAKIYIEENKIHEAYNKIDNALTLSKKKSYKNLTAQSLIMMAFFL